METVGIFTVQSGIKEIKRATFKKHTNFSTHFPFWVTNIKLALPTYNSIKLFFNPYKKNNRRNCLFDLDKVLFLIEHKSSKKKIQLSSRIESI